GTSTRARPSTGPLKFIRVSKKGRSVVCRSRLVAILPRPFHAYTYKTGEAVCRCPPAQPQFWQLAMLVRHELSACSGCGDEAALAECGDAIVEADLLGDEAVLDLQDG